MKEIIGNLFGFLYTLSMGDYIFLSLTFILILLFIYMIHLIKKEENKSDDSLHNIVKSIEKDYKPVSVNLTEYESEQEKNAIISYDELIKNKENMNISYDDEYVSNNDEVLIKKISFKETDFKEEPEKINVKLMSYEKEEEFLIALKQLQQNLLN